MVSIEPIDKNTVNQICSGQVITNLAIAVKELLENSIDAGATSIQIKLGEYGSDFVEVIDNGCGIEDVNYQALTLKHHTSKIKNFLDINQVETFGFRGEALSSLCSLSNVTVITQHKNSSIGATLKFNHEGQISSNIKTYRKVGTTVKIENLFCTLPVRRNEFLKNLKKEFSKMCNVLFAYSLHSLGIRITCSNQTTKFKVGVQKIEEQSKRLTYTTIIDTKGESLESNIVSIFGPKQKQNILKVDEVLPSKETLKEFGLEYQTLDLNKFKLHGFISSCAHGCGRASPDRQFYFINSRPVDNHKISKIVNEIYHQYNHRQDPFVILNIKVNNGSFDLNVTPDKRQILLQHETLLLAILKESLHSVFRNVPSTLEVQNLDINKTFPEKKKSPKKIENFKDYFTNLMIQKEERKINYPNNDFKKISQQFIMNNEERKFFSTKSHDLETVCMLKPKVFTIKSDNSKINAVESKNIMGENPINCSKRKLNCATQKINEVFEMENNNKRIKYDCGLDENEKKKRKKIHYNIDFLDIKQRRLVRAKAKKEQTDQIKFSAQIKAINNEKAEMELKKEITKDNFKKMEIIGQFNLGFIITRLNSDIFIIDQHASDEKYNFEILKSTTIIQSQKLFNPEKLELTVDREELMLQYREVFKNNGFDFVFNINEPITKRISLTAIPFSKNTLFGKEDIDELLFFLEECPEWKTLRPSRVNNMFASRACRKSIMIGTPLSYQDMRKIIDHMGDLEQPWNCPHGRPTMRHLINLNSVNFEK